MLTKLHYTVSESLLQEAADSLFDDTRTALNQPSGSFFNDPWILKPEYKDTVWDQILATLEESKGEARLIKLEQGESYPSHADIDDRWHLSITGNHCYLIDLETNTMHPTDDRSSWYLMDAGVRHTAANFGTGSRIQLVVRKLLPNNVLKDPIQVHVTLKKVVEDRRFLFDDTMSPWLNRAYKRGIVNNFVGEDLIASFNIEIEHLEELEELTRGYFIVSIDV
jgi:hypothetical protein